jgi:hypothetical protein
MYIVLFVTGLLTLHGFALPLHSISIDKDNSVKSAFQD